MRTPLIALLLLPVAGSVAIRDLAAQPAAPAPNLFPEGPFEILDSEGIPLSWRTPHPSHQQRINAAFRTQTEPDGNRYVILENLDATKVLHMAAEIPVPAGTARVRVTFRLRARALAVSPEPEWAAVQLGGGWVDADGKHITHLRTEHRVRADVPEWVTLEEVFSSPAGATKIVLQPGLYHTSGAIDLDDFKVFAEPAVP